MQVKSIAECSKGSILEYFWPSFRPWAGYRPPPPRGNFVHYDFLKLHYIRHKIKYVSPLRVAALTCNITLYTLPPEIALKVPDNVSTMTCSYIFACWHRLVYEFHIFSINFINVLSYHRCIRYLVFPALFPSMTVFMDYTCNTAVTEYSKSIRLLLKWFKIFIMVAYTIFQVHVTYVNLKIALNIQLNVSNKPCLYLFACWHRFMYFLTRLTYFKYSLNKCLEL